MMYTNELPALISDPSEQNSCISCYADDTTYVATDVDPERLSAKLRNGYNCIADFMLNNRLKLNDDKTNFMVFGTNKSQMAKVELKTGSLTIKPSTTGKLLGCWITRI